jgi:TPR repeat protein
VARKAPPAAALFIAGERAFESGRNDAAVALFRRAAALGYLPAVFNVGVLLNNSKGTPLYDVYSGLKWSLRAAELGHPQAALWAGDLLFRGHEGIPLLRRDHPRALRLVALAARSDSVAKHEATERLLGIASIYLGNTPSPSGLIQAATVADRRAFARLAYAEAARAGKTGALVALAELDLEDAQGAAARTWLEEGLSRGSAQCARRLARLLEEGAPGVKRDARRAKQVRARAAELDQPFMGAGAMIVGINGVHFQVWLLPPMLPSAGDTPAFPPRCPRCRAAQSA